ncbi:MAG: cytochrome P450 [Chloroflexota bacterium]|nr:cytochrome P450 [Chloroflexota bacterium]
MTKQTGHFPPGYPAIGNPIQAFFLMLPYQTQFFERIMRDFDRFGDIFGAEVMGQRQVMIRHPDLIHAVTTRQADQFHKDTATYKDPQKGLAKFLGSGLLTSDGDFWKRQRKLMAPAFHFRRIAGYAQIMSDEARRLGESWRGRDSVDVDADMMRATLAIVARALFSSDMGDRDVSRIGGAMTEMQHFGSNLLMQLLPSWLPLPAHARQDQAVRDLDEVVYALIRHHRAMPADNGDLLWMLLDARDEDDRGMTDRQIRDELVTLFLAGHETTANTLNWVWVLLAQHPDKEAALHHELDTALGGRLPTLDDLKNLPYTDQVIKEAMRLYPPIYSFGREAIADVRIGDYDLPKGTIVNLMTWAVQRDPRWFPQPEAFQPERWTPDFEAALPKGAYIPFGGGPRICIGNSFASMEAQILLATLAGRYRLRLQGDAPQPDPLLTLRPRGGLRMRVEARSVAPVAAPIHADNVPA